MDHVSGKTFARLTTPKMRARAQRRKQRQRPVAAIDNRELIATKGKLAMPMLAMGGEKSFGPQMAEVMTAAATNVTEGVVPDSGHWIMEENPAATMKVVHEFLQQKS